MSNNYLLDYLNNETLTYSTFWENSDSDYSAEFDVPGFEKSDIEIKSKTDKLTIQVKTSKKGRQGFTISYRFPSTADLSKTEASLDLGILKIVVPKKESEKPKEISIKVS